MGESIGRTYGFGRVSARLEPSPYSPLHRPSQIPGSSPVVRPALPARPRGGRIATLVAVVAIAAAATLVLTFANRPTTPQVTARGAPAASPPPLSEEAERLPRSAIAVSKYPKPRS